VERASGLLFRASRPEPVWGVQLVFNYPATYIQRPATKFGVTPNLTGVTPVPPGFIHVPLHFHLKQILRTQS
jgi:hypothetical protein